MTELQRSGILQRLDDDHQTDLFKRNFLIMNALYQLQALVFPKQWLQVEAMNIRLYFNEFRGSSEHLKNFDPLREYYLDWQNYNASYVAIRDLLKTFWFRYQGFVGHSAETTLERRKALSTLGLSEQADDDEIRRQWRKMALKWHPDRPKGDATTFRAMCEAWQSLKM